MAKQYLVTLLDLDLNEITSHVAESLKEAKHDARYMLSEDYARYIGSTHQALQTHKVEINEANNNLCGQCVWDCFYENSVGDPRTFISLDNA